MTTVSCRCKTVSCKKGEFVQMLQKSKQTETLDQGESRCSGCMREYINYKKLDTKLIKINVTLVIR